MFRMHDSSGTRCLVHYLIKEIWFSTTMTLKRFLRDFALLFGFCGAFYLLTVMMGRLDKEPPGDSDFSETRKRADVSMRNQDWKSATADFRSLTRKDPYNGHAWYRCASSLNAQRHQVYQSLQEALAETSQAQESSGLTGESEKLLSELRADLDRISAEAKDAFKKAKEFARYRGNSLLHLAAIESREGNKAMSLEYLSQFVGNGNYTRRGLESYRDFGVGGPEFANSAAPDGNLDVRLHAEPKFWEIVRKESYNQSQ